MFSFDIKTFFASIIGKILPQAAADKTQATDQIKIFLASKEQRLKQLAESRLSGDVDNDYVAASLKNEILIAEAEADALAMFGEVKAEEILNTISTEFQSALLNFLSLYPVL